MKKQVLGIDAKNELIEMVKNRMQVWQQSENRAQDYLELARAKRKQAEKELRSLTK